ncbi:malate dehydrogenase (NAD) [Alicyclobacillus sacchari]|uniref:Malate dehydrogenase n=1 Tax=Alicyclobacillus sacchari TaxID=392010 RepID=A0A4R8LUT1_9BACL|nr:malate dehydrogenase [Alicyclobacillus sacchari]TDY51288.1 malate dehydrogenase (NAD) [Alicyclobacillus sacchari]GMA56584.1 malate dehydrogenase [Alicyclobacillus sacchari]
MLKRKKISVIGAGFTGATTAFMLALKELGDVVLLDIPQLESPTQGKALDMLEAMPVVGSDVRVTGSSDYKDTTDSDLVIITAGVARKPGMSRDDLVTTNAGIVKAVTEQVVHHSPNAIIVVLSNPVDAMTYVAYKASGLPKQRIIGQAGVLDTARFNAFVAAELGVSVEDVHGFVLGVHGDDMVPLVRYSNVGGIPLAKLLSAERIEQIVQRTRTGGGEIVGLLGTGSAYYAPAASLAQMAESILKDKRRLLPAIAYLEGEYGYHDLFLGVPTILGANGIERIVDIELLPEERAALDKSADSVRKVIAVLQ